MKWNNAHEYALFKEEQEKLRKEYLAAGMTEEEIKAMYEFDLKYLNLRQREARHTQRLTVTADEEEENMETQNPLLKKFLHNLSTEDTHFEDDRFSWIEQIESKKLYKALKAMSEVDKEIITMLLEGYQQKDIAIKFGVKKAAISRKIGRLKEIYKKFFIRCKLLALLLSYLLRGVEQTHSKEKGNETEYFRLPRLLCKQRYRKLCRVVRPP